MGNNGGKNNNFLALCLQKLTCRNKQPEKYSLENNNNPPNEELVNVTYSVIDNFTTVVRLKISVLKFMP